LAGAPLRPLHRFGLRRRRPALGGRLGAAFVLMQCVSGSAWGWRRAAAPPAPASSLQVPLTLRNYLFLKWARPLYRLRQTKKPPSNGGMPSLSQIRFESQQKILLGEEIEIRFN